jgi:hypothetical protein
MTQLIIDKLNQIADLQSKVDLYRSHFDQIRADLITPELAAELKDLEIEQATSIEPIQQQISELEREIRERVAMAAQSVSGDYLRAIFVKGRTSWDTKALDGFAAAHPEIEKFRKLGKPSVRIENI